MNKHIDKIKKNAAEEAMKTGMVIIGAVTGLLSAKGLRKLTEEHPSLDAIVQYLTPFVLAGGGFIISAVTEKDHKGKYFGYGLSVAGGIEGIKLIPVAKDYLSGILGETEISANSFLTENEERQKLMNGFGLSALPVGNASLSDAPSYETRLPDLEGTDDSGNTKNEDLGYNKSFTDNTDPLGSIL